MSNQCNDCVTHASIQNAHRRFQLTDIAHHQFANCTNHHNLHLNQETYLRFSSPGLLLNCEVTGGNWESDSHTSDNAPFWELPVHTSALMSHISIWELHHPLLSAWLTVTLKLNVDSLKKAHFARRQVALRQLPAVSSSCFLQPILPLKSSCALSACVDHTPLRRTGQPAHVYTHTLHRRRLQTNHFDGLNIGHC